MKAVNEVSVEYISHMGDDTAVVNSARVSFAKEHKEFQEEQDSRLLRYLAKHSHWSPFAHTCISVRCSVPIFLARQLVKHQVGGSWNEESRRYIDTDPEFYIPDVYHTRADSAKQGCGVELSLADNQRTKYELLEHSNKCFKLYKTQLELGLAPEEARMFLPLNTMTNFIWTGSLYFFHRVIKQRSDPHAQTVAREFAQKLEAVIKGCYPKAYEALKEYD